MSEGILTAREVKRIIDSGIKPIIEFTEKAQLHDLDPDVGMRCELISCSNVDENDCIWFTCDFKGWKDYNKQFAKPVWYDKSHNPTLTWFESGYYPEDGKYEICQDADYELDVFTIVKTSKYYKTYLESGSLLSYITWLEKKIEELESR
jgi:hypothetical protein